MYSCEVCQIPVIVIDGTIIRPCKHQDAPVVASLTATVYGEGHMQKEEGDAGV